MNFVMPMNKTDGPLISVIMGIRYLRSDLSLLRRSIDSVMNQTYSNYEFLICENGSTDEAKNCLKEYFQKDIRLKQIYGNDAETLAEKLNRCLHAAQGEYIARMDDDDWSEPDRLQKQLSTLQRHREKAFVGCNAKLLRDGRPAGQRIFPEFPTVKDFLFVQPYLHPTLLFRREVLDRIGGYCEEKRCNGCEDYDLLLRLYQAGYVGFNLQEPLLTYTLPDTGIRKPYRYRWYEAQTRYVRFGSMKMLPNALPYVLKPLVVGLLPNKLLQKLKRQREKRCGRHG